MPIIKNRPIISRILVCYLYQNGVNQPIRSFFLLFKAFIFLAGILTEPQVILTDLVKKKHPSQAQDVFFDQISLKELS